MDSQISYSFVLVLKSKGPYQGREKRIPEDSRFISKYDIDVFFVDHDSSQIQEHSKTFWVLLAGALTDLPISIWKLQSTSWTAEYSWQLKSNSVQATKRQSPRQTCHYESVETVSQLIKAH